MASNVWSQFNMAPTWYENAEELKKALHLTGAPTRVVTIDILEFIRTRDALTSAYTNLSNSLDIAVKAYVQHTNTIIAADGQLNVTMLAEPLNRIGKTAQQVAQQALSAQSNGGIDPQLLQNGDGAIKDESKDKKKRTKRAYKQRDPNAPKRPLTAYFRYLGEQRPLIMEEVKKDPTLFDEAGKPGDISKIATKRWNQLTEAQQAPYKKAYQDALLDYTEKAAAYKKANGADATKMDVDTTEIDPELEANAGAEDEHSAAESSDNESSGSSSSDSESDADGESDDEITKPASPPTKGKKKTAATPHTTSKKGSKAAKTFSSIPEPVETPAVRSTSPEKKRKAGAEAEDTGKSSKKKSRKSTVTAGADPVPSPAPAAAPTAVMQSSPPATDKSAKKAKKDKKKRKSTAEA